MSATRRGLLLILYALIVLYSSTIVGVAGPHYVPIPWQEALHRLLHMPYVDHDSGQRSDWMGNLVMAVPLGFLTAGAFSPRRFTPTRAATALVICFAFIVAVKYAQLFFPPRTVTLNYVIAQSLGAAVGMGLYGLLRSPLAALGLGRLESPRVILCIYTGLLIVFLLMPLDFALDADDVTMQLAKLPLTLTNIIGEGRPPRIRFALLLVSILATAPLGALLTLARRCRVPITRRPHVIPGLDPGISQGIVLELIPGSSPGMTKQGSSSGDAFGTGGRFGRSVSEAAWIGCFAMCAVYAASTLVMSGSSSVPAIGFHTAGVALGAWFMHWLTRQDPGHVRRELAGLVVWAAPLYLLLLFAVNGLLSLDWRRPDAAAARYYDLGLLPLFNYYIVSKAQAAKNIAGHAAMYAPIGVLVWLRVTKFAPLVALVTAALLSAIVEGGRFLRPNLASDINAIPVAGIAAWAAAAVMPMLWETLTSVTTRRTPTPAEAVRGEVEHY